MDSSNLLPPVGIESPAAWALWLASLPAADWVLWTDWLLKGELPNWLRAALLADREKAMANLTSIHGETAH